MMQPIILTHNNSELNNSELNNSSPIISSPIISELNKSSPIISSPIISSPNNSSPINSKMDYVKKLVVPEKNNEIQGKKKIFKIGAGSFSTVYDLGEYAIKRLKKNSTDLSYVISSTEINLLFTNNSPFIIKGIMIYEDIFGFDIHMEKCTGCIKNLNKYLNGINTNGNLKIIKKISLNVVKIILPFCQFLLCQL